MLYQGLKSVCQIFPIILNTESQEHQIVPVLQPLNSKIWSVVFLALKKFFYELSCEKNNVEVGKIGIKLMQSRV